MAIPIEDYEKIFASRPRRGPGDDPPEFTAEEERILDRVWAELAEKLNKPTPVETMSDIDTLKFFGFDPPASPEK